MIAQLRKRHSQVFLLGFPLLIILYIIAVSSRTELIIANHERSKKDSKEESKTETKTSIPHIPKAYRGQANSIAKVNFNLGDTIKVSAYAWKVKSEYFLSLDYQKTTGLEATPPDLLLYIQDKASAKLGPKALLLESLDTKKQQWISIPHATLKYISATKDPTFVIYSLGHSNIVASFRAKEMFQKGF